MRIGHHLWMEGFRATGDWATATYLGWWPGRTLVRSARLWARLTFNMSDFRVQDGNPVFWGCRIYDNEADARRVFG